MSPRPVLQRDFKFWVKGRGYHSEDDDMASKRTLRSASKTDRPTYYQGRVYLGPFARASGQFVALYPASKEMSRNRELWGEAFKYFPAYVSSTFMDVPYSGVLLDNHSRVLFLLDLALDTCLLAKDYGQLVMRYPGNFHLNGRFVLNLPPLGPAVTIKTIQMYLAKLPSPLSIIADRFAAELEGSLNGVNEDAVLVLHGYRLVAERSWEESETLDKMNVERAPWVDKNSIKPKAETVVKRFVADILKKPSWVQADGEDLAYSMAPRVEPGRSINEYRGHVLMDNEAPRGEYVDESPLGCRPANWTEKFWLTLRFPHIRPQHYVEPGRTVPWPVILENKDGKIIKVQDVGNFPSNTVTTVLKSRADEFHQPSQDQFEAWTPEIPVVFIPCSGIDPNWPDLEPTTAEPEPMLPADINAHIDAELQAQRDGKSDRAPVKSHEFEDTDALYAMDDPETPAVVAKPKTKKGKATGSAQKLTKKEQKAAASKAKKGAAANPLGFLKSPKPPVAETPQEETPKEKVPKATSSKVGRFKDTPKQAAPVQQPVKRTRSGGTVAPHGHPRMFVETVKFAKQVLFDILLETLGEGSLDPLDFERIEAPTGYTQAEWDNAIQYVVVTHPNRSTDSPNDERPINILTTQIKEKVDAQKALEDSAPPDPKKRKINFTDAFANYGKDGTPSLVSPLRSADTTPPTASSSKTAPAPASFEIPAFKPRPARADAQKPRTPAVAQGDRAKWDALAESFPKRPPRAPSETSSGTGARSAMAPSASGTPRPVASEAAWKTKYMDLRAEGLKFRAKYEALQKDHTTLLAENQDLLKENSVLKERNVKLIQAQDEFRSRSRQESEVESQRSGEEVEEEEETESVDTELQELLAEDPASVFGMADMAASA